MYLIQLGITRRHNCETSSLENIPYAILFYLLESLVRLDELSVCRPALFAQETV